MASTDHPNYQDLVPNTGTGGFDDSNTGASVIDDHGTYQDFFDRFFRPFVRQQINPGIQKPGG